MTRTALAYLPLTVSPRPPQVRPQPRRAYHNPFSRYPSVQPKPRLGVKNYAPQNASGLTSKTHANPLGITPVADKPVVGCSVAAERVPTIASTTGRAASQIDRVAFKAEREAFWKAEAQTNPGSYSASDLAKMNRGRPPIGPDGFPMELHHVDRTSTGPIAPMSRTDHRLGDNYKLNHPEPGN
jgi:A nuclease of the HNH/ENDO VII superfamily with conserved LHH